MKNSIVVISLVILYFSVAQSCKKRINWDKLASEYSENAQDSTKLEALHFLKKNMTGHFSNRILLVSKKGDTVNFHEKQFGNIDSLENFLANGYSILLDSVYDEKILTTDIIKQSIDNSFNSWKKYKWNQHVPKDIFFNYLLPYKIHEEYPENWLKRLAPFQKEYLENAKNGIIADYGAINLAYDALVNHNFTGFNYNDTFPKISNSPGINELLTLKNGDCIKQSYLNCYQLRFLGIPSTIDVVPLWGTVSGNHAVEVFWGENNRMQTLPGRQLVRPPKVFRHSFKRTGLWTDSIKPLLKKKYYSPNFLKSDYLLDVTNEHTKTIDIVYPIPVNKSIAYICVYNYGKWQPVYFGKINTEKRQTIFHKMATDMAYAVAVPHKNTYKLIDKIFIVNKRGNKISSSPDFRRKQNLIITKTNPGSKATLIRGISYTLMYLDTNNLWIPFATQRCKDSVLVFKGVPSNAFYMTKEEATRKNLARLFRYKTGKQVWY